MGRKRIHPIKERVAPKVKRKGRFETPKEEKVKDELMTYMIHLRGTGPTDPNKPKTVRSKNLVEVIKFSIESFGKDRLLEIHDFKGDLLWGKNTGINKENYVK